MTFFVNFYSSSVHIHGSGSYVFRPVHAHILVVGWLSCLFAWAVLFVIIKNRVQRSNCQNILVISFRISFGLIGNSIDSKLLPDF